MRVNVDIGIIAIGVFNVVCLVRGALHIPVFVMARIYAIWQSKVLLSRSNVQLQDIPHHFLKVLNLCYNNMFSTKYIMLVGFAMSEFNQIVDYIIWFICRMPEPFGLLSVGLWKEYNINISKFVLYFIIYGGRIIEQQFDKIKQQGELQWQILKQVHHPLNPSLMN